MYPSASVDFFHLITFLPSAVDLVVTLTLLTVTASGWLSDSDSLSLSDSDSLGVSSVTLSLSVSDSLGVSSD